MASIAGAFLKSVASGGGSFLFDKWMGSVLGNKPVDIEAQVHYTICGVKRHISYTVLVWEPHPDH